MSATLPTRGRLQILAAALIAALAATALVVTSAAPSSANNYTYALQIWKINFYACEASSTSVRVMGESKASFGGTYRIEGRTSSTGYYSISSSVPLTFNSRTYLTVSTKSSDSYIMVRYRWSGWSAAYPIYKSAIPNC